AKVVGVSSKDKEFLRRPPGKVKEGWGVSAASTEVLVWLAFAGFLLLCVVVIVTFAVYLGFQFFDLFRRPAERPLPRPEFGRAARTPPEAGRDAAERMTAEGR